MCNTNLRAVDLFARTRHRRLTVELAQSRISLFQRVCVHARWDPYTPRTPPSRSGVRRQIRSRAYLRLVIVGQPFGVGTSITLQLLLDPIDGPAVALRSLAPVPKLGETFDTGFVFFELQTVHKKLHRILCERRRERKTYQDKAENMVAHGYLYITNSYLSWERSARQRQVRRLPVELACLTTTSA